MLADLRKRLPQGVTDLLDVLFVPWRFPVIDLTTTLRVGSAG